MTPSRRSSRTALGAITSPAPTSVKCVRLLVDGGCEPRLVQEGTGGEWQALMDSSGSSMPMNWPLQILTGVLRSRNGCLH